MPDIDEVKLLRDEFRKCYDELMRQREILDDLKDNMMSKEVASSLVSVIERTTTIIDELVDNAEAPRESCLQMQQIKKDLKRLKKKLL